MKLTVTLEAAEIGAAIVLLLKERGLHVVNVELNYEPGDWPFVAGRFLARAQVEDATKGSAK